MRRHNLAYILFFTFLYNQKEGTKMSYVMIHFLGKINMLEHI